MKKMKFRFIVECSFLIILASNATPAMQQTTPNKKKILSNDNLTLVSPKQDQSSESDKPERHKIVMQRVGAIECKPSETKSVVGNTVGVGGGYAGPYRPAYLRVDNNAEEIPVYSAKAVDEKAIITYKPEPIYTPEAHKSGLTGTVVLRAVFMPSGEVVVTGVAQCLPEGLTEKAIEATRLIRFTPARLGGRAVAQLMRLEYNFNLD